MNGGSGELSSQIVSEMPSSHLFKCVTFIVYLKRFVCHWELPASMRKQKYDRCTHSCAAVITHQENATCEENTESECQRQGKVKRLKSETPFEHPLNTLCWALIKSAHTARNNSLRISATCFLKRRYKGDTAASSRIV